MNPAVMMLANHLVTSTEPVRFGSTETVSFAYGMPLGAVTDPSADSVAEAVPPVLRWAADASEIALTVGEVG